jgi:hypothetical protein
MYHVSPPAVQPFHVVNVKNNGSSQAEQQQVQGPAPGGWGLYAICKRHSFSTHIPKH